MAKIKGREMQNTRTTQRYVIEKETETLGVKPLRRPPNDKQSTKEYSWDT